MEVDFKTVMIAVGAFLIVAILVHGLVQFWRERRRNLRSQRTNLSRESFISLNTPRKNRGAKFSCAARNIIGQLTCTAANVDGTYRGNTVKRESHAPPAKTSSKNTPRLSRRRQRNIDYVAMRTAAPPKTAFRSAKLDAQQKPKH